MNINKHSKPGVFNPCSNAVIVLGKLYYLCTSGTFHSKVSQKNILQKHKALIALASGYNLFGFSSFNRNTLLIMRNLMKSTMVLVITLFSVVFAIAQNGTAKTQTEIIHEFVEGKFNHLKAQYGNIEVIFRNDRLEIFESTPSGSEEKQSFLLFDNANIVEPKPIGLIEHKILPIENEGMATVLGVKEMNVDAYEKVVYKDLYKGADLVITVSEKQISFVLDNKTNQSSIPFGLSTWGNGEMTLLNDIISLVNHNNVEISSADKQLKVEGRALNFNSNKSKSTDISFTLNFLN